MDLFKLLGTIAIENGDALDALRNTSQEGQKTESKLKKAFSSVGKGAVAVGKAVGTGMVAAGTAMGALTVKALNLSGELEQNMGGSEQVFKEHAGKMQETAKNAFQNMGLSTSDFLATANKMGALFQGAGFSIKESSDLSASAMQRAADVASIMGVDTSAAMEAIAGAAKGNFTMMDNLGVAMNDTTLNAYALEKGINKTTQEMTNQEKISLAMEMFMDKTAYAAGNYAKENETLAGSLGTAKAALTNFLDGSGDVDQLVTAFSSAANVIVKNVKEIAPRLVSGVTDIINQIIPILPPLLQELLPSVISGAVSLIEGLVSALPSVLNVLTTSVLPLLLSGFVTIFNSIIEQLPTLIESIVSILPTLLPQLISGLVTLIVALCTNFSAIIQPILDYLPEIIVSVVDALLENLPALIQGCISLVMGICRALPQILSALWEAIKGVFSSAGGKVSEWFSPIWNSISQWFSGLVTSVSQWFSNVWEGVKSVCLPFVTWIDTNIIQPVVGFFQGLWEGVKVVWDGICNVISFAIQFIGSILSAAFQIITLPFRFIWENCKEYVFAAWEWIKGKVSTAINAVKSVISTVMNAIKTTFTTIWNAIKNVFTTVWNAISNFITPIVNAIKNTISNVFNAIKTTISNIFNSVKSTVTSVWNSIKSTISSVINGIKSAISSVFNGIKSTISSVFNGIKSTATSVWNGIKSAITKPVEEAKNKVKGVVDAIKGFFDKMKINLPKIKLPHFKVSGSLSIAPPSVPKLTIDWYKKAMNNPMVLDDPTIFGYNPTTGSFMGAGEAGSEVVSGTNTLLNMIQRAVSGEIASMSYYLKQIITILADYFPQLLEVAGHDILLDGRMVAKATVGYMDEELGHISNRKNRGR